MTNQTWNKVQEANYFLEKMQQLYEDDNEFDYNLSAFLSAFRSITYYLQKQYSNYNDFKEWYMEQQEKMYADPELHFLNKARVENVHKEYVQTGAERSLGSAIDMILVKEGESQPEDVQESKINRPTQQRKFRRFFVKYKQFDAIDFCENQMAKIIELVKICENQFR